MRMDRRAPCRWPVAAISIASTPSAISSPAPAPTIPTPSTRSVFGSRMSLVTPSVRSIVDRATRCAPWKLRDGDLAAFFLRLRFRQAAPRDFRIGEHHGGNRVRLERDFFVRQCARPQCDPRAKLCAPAWARRPRRQWRRSTARPRLQLLVHLDESARDSTARSSCRVRGSANSACVQRRRAHGRTRALFRFTSAPSNVTRMPPALVLHLNDGVFSMIAFEDARHALVQRTSRGRGPRPAAVPPVISTTVTSLPSAA